MLKKIFCLFWGHLPWRTVAETTHQPTPEGVRWYEGTFYQVPLNIMFSHNARMLRGGKTVTVTCDRCGTIKTTEH